MVMTDISIDVTTWVSIVTRLLWVQNAWFAIDVRRPDLNRYNNKKCDGNGVDRLVNVFSYEGLLLVFGIV